MIKELATRNAESLAEKLAAVNDDKKLTRCTSNDTVAKVWIEQVKSLHLKIEY